MGFNCKTTSQEGKKLLEHKDQKKEMKKYMECSLKDMKLDDRQTIGYTFKALGAGFYGLRKGVDFKTTITEVIMEAGDADRYVKVVVPHHKWVSKSTNAIFLCCI